MNTKEINLFERCIQEVQKKNAFVDGQKENYVKALANLCNRNGISIEDAKISVKQKFNFNDEIVTKIINKEYLDKKNFGIDQKKSIEDFLNENYDFRYNEVVEKVEYKIKKDRNYLPMTDYKINSICRELEKIGHKSVSDSKIHKLLISDFVLKYNPFVEYFNNLPVWDGHDYISELADFVKTDDPEFWKEALKRWLVAMVACSITNNVTNHSVIIFRGGQGIGKSTFIDKILPPELKTYKYSGTINPYSKDSLILLSENILIDLDELGSLNRKDEKAMKEIITKSEIKLRRPYGRINELLPRRASFIGSVNDKEFLMDMSGSRRFLCFEVFKIAYDAEINHKGIYSQVISLLKSGFKYWFDGKDIELINEKNERFRIKDPIEEMILVKYKPCEKNKTTIFLSSTDILNELNETHRISLDSTNSIMVGKILNKYNFQKKKNGGISKYAVQYI
ncbi:MULTISPECIES: VapE domain-containing protein [Chryseobacterium]|uniref:VapE domain-containing protein n=1 Tax=Chryseobacterium TaxID=59732 RepID=UPI001E3D858A|nr:MULTISPECIES: VapE domain-containing protein [Chryseobacterium]